jgi:hypothetical protein
MPCMGRLLGTLVAAALLLGAAPAAQAEPVALLDAPRAQDVGLVGDEVVVGRRTARGGIRVDAIPISGGTARPLLSLSAPGRAQEAWVKLAVAPGVVAALVSFVGDDDLLEVRRYSGPPAGPLEPRSRVKLTSDRRWLPLDIAADADRVLLSEARFRPRLEFRANVLAPGAAPEPVTWAGSLVGPVALSGERVAFLGSTRTDEDARLDHLYVIDRHSGAVETSAKLRGYEDAEYDDLDLAPDGRAVIAVDGSLLTVAPGVAPARQAGRFSRPRLSGDGIAVLQEGRFRARAPVLLAPGAAARALGSPSTAVDAFEADDRGAGWIANGCVLYAPRDGAPPAEPPAGPCPRVEVVHEEGDQVLRGRRLGVRISCVAAPASGCRGTALLGGRGRFGRAAFRLAPGTRRTIEVRLTDRGMRRVRRAQRHHTEAFFRLSARVRDGRAHGTLGVLVDRVR